jgi:hypothetical protein
MRAEFREDPQPRGDAGSLSIRRVPGSRLRAGLIGGAALVAALGAFAYLTQPKHAAHG